MTCPRIITASLGASLVALDFTAFGPWMFSQPMVCGIFFGWLMGHIAIGVILGGIAQLLWMDVTPVGVGIPFDATATTLLSIYWATIAPNESWAQVAMALGIAVPFGYLFRWMDLYSRRVNTRVVRLVEQAPDERLVLSLWLGMIGGLVWYWTRYFSFYLLMLWSGTKLWVYLNGLPIPPWVDRSLSLMLILLPVAGLGVTLELLLSDNPEGRWSALRSFGATRRKTPRP